MGVGMMKMMRGVQGVLKKLRDTMIILGSCSLKSKYFLLFMLAIFFIITFPTNLWAESWAFKAPMPSERKYTATAILNGKIYVIGGMLESGGAVITNQVEAYDTITNTWSTVAPLNTQRAYVAASTANGKIYVFGGRTDASCGSCQTNTVEMYDASTNTWSYVASMPEPRQGHTSSEVNGKIYVIGGTDWTVKKDTVWEYNPTTNSWDPTPKSNMPTARCHMQSAVIDGKIYVPAGVITDTGLTTLEVYDPSNDTWETKANLNYGRWYAATAAVNGKLYVFGGMSNGDKVEEYDPSTNVWLIKPNMPVPMNEYSNSSAQYNGKIYLFGGRNTSLPEVVTNYVLEYCVACSEKIVFSQNTSGSDQDLWLVNPYDRNDLERLTTTPAINEMYPAISPGGKTLAYIDYNNKRLMTMDICTKVSTLRYQSSAYLIGYPAWSPDGKEISYTEGEYNDYYNIRAYKLSDNTHRSILANGNLHWVHSWSSDGLRIAYGEDNQSIWTMDSSDGGNRTSLNTGSVSDYPDWSPDGSKILYMQRNPYPPGEIWVMDFNGNNKQPLFASPANEWVAQWSPSGNKIVFMRESDLYTIDYVTKDEYRLTLTGNNNQGDWGIVNCESSVQLLKTGQKTCYDELGNGIPCAGTGQDGEIQAGVAWPSPRFTVGTGAEADCVTDNLTGLIWAKNGNLPNGTRTWQEALDYVASMNSGAGLCGYHDWYLPNRKEISSLIDYSKFDTALPVGDSFENVQLYFYWSSSTYSGSTDNAWVVNISYGYVNYNPKTDNRYVWPVRAGQSDGVISLPATGQTTSYAVGDDGDLERGVAWPNPRYTVNSDCVNDNLTGLIWAKNGNLPNGTRTWQGALDYIISLNAGSGLCGYNDWRLPNTNEIESLLNTEMANTATWLNGEGFTNVQSYHYWSSSTYASITSDAWNVYIHNGSVNDISKSGSSAYVWPLRGGTLTTPLDTTAPSTTADPAGGTYSSAQTVTLNCNDGSGSGCQTTYYCTGTGCTPTATYSGAINISSSTVLRFYSTDNSNNNESVNIETYTIDTTPPTGSISINSGAAYTNTTSVTLTLSCADASGCDQMCISNTASCLSWEGYSSTKAWTLTSGNGTKTVYAWLKDSLGNANTTPYSDSIVLDTGSTNDSVSVPPGTDVTIIFPNGASVTLPNVTSACTATLTEVTNPTHNPPPSFNFIRYGYFDISTDCTYTGPVTIVYPYDESQIRGQEQNLKLFHWKNNGWEDSTISVDTVNNTITGRVTSLSDFGIGSLLGGGTGANEYMIAFIAMLTISTGLFILRRNRPIKSI
jgi:N-acetylneuraminic acid mutarotase